MLMKKLLLLLLSVVSISVFADNVTVERASLLAKKFFKKNVDTRGAVEPQLKLVWDGETAETRAASAEEPAYYVFNRTDEPGFVIVSAEDATLPILAYSTEYNFFVENMPSNLAAWMERLRTSIKTMRAAGEVPSAEVNEAWANLPVYTSGEDELRLETALWNQGSPYNLECPEVDGKRAVTGCVATAFAIVMRYHQWPDKTAKSIPSYYFNKSDGTSVFVSMRSRHTYDWSQMPLKIEASTTDEEKMQIAILMRDCGQMAEAAYGSSTGATTSTAALGLLNYMKYDKGLMLLRRENYTEEKWVSMLKKELQEYGPVIYGGLTTNNEGHQFVLDGYNSENYFHLNWGWGGQSNGYFLISNLTPGSQGAGGSASGKGFTENQDAVFYVKKAVENRPVAANIMFYKYTFTNSSGAPTFAGIEPSVSKFAKGVPFDVKLGAFWNYGFEAFAGNLALALVDKNYNIREILGIYDFAEKGSELEPMYLTAFSLSNCKITKELNEGDRLVALHSTVSGAQVDEWRMVVGNIKDVTNEVIVKPESTTGIQQTAKEQNSFIMTLNGDVLLLNAAVEIESIALYDLNGKMLQNVESVNETSYSFSVKAYAPGIYLLKVKTEKGVETCKFIKK